jgi:type I restriction enzyme R subunit
VEAKAEHKNPADGLQQAKEYAQVLGLNFAYATNGRGMIEFDFLSGMEREIDDFPTPEALWTRLKNSEGLTEDQTKRLLTPYNTYAGKHPRYYQEIAINCAVRSILQGKRRNLLNDRRNPGPHQGFRFGPQG